MTTRLLVSNLSLDTIEDSVAEVFRQDSRSVDRIALVTNRDTGCSRGFAFVEMATEADARSAIKVLHGTELDGCLVRVDEMRDRHSRGSDRSRRINLPARPQYTW